MYLENLIEGITVHYGQHIYRQQVLNDCEQRHLAKIVSDNRQATLTQIPSIFTAGDARRISNKSITQLPWDMGAEVGTVPHLGSLRC